MMWGRSSLSAGVQETHGSHQQRNTSSLQGRETTVQQQKLIDEVTGDMKSQERYNALLEMRECLNENIRATKKRTVREMKDAKIKEIEEGLEAARKDLEQEE